MVMFPTNWYANPWLGHRPHLLDYVFVYSVYSEGQVHKPKLGWRFLIFLDLSWYIFLLELRLPYIVQISADSC